MKTLFAFAFFEFKQVDKIQRKNSKIIHWFWCLVLFESHCFGWFCLFLKRCISKERKEKNCSYAKIDVHMHRNRFRYYENIFICRPQTSINNEIISHNLLRNRPCQKEHRFVVISCIPISNHLRVFYFRIEEKIATSKQSTNQPTTHSIYTKRIISRFVKYRLFFEHCFPAKWWNLYAGSWHLSLLDVGTP